MIPAMDDHDSADDDDDDDDDDGLREVLNNNKWIDRSILEAAPKIA